MYNDYIIEIASDILLRRLHEDELDMLSVPHIQGRKFAIQQHADASIEIARIFLDRVRAVLPPEKPFTLLDDHFHEIDE